MNKETIDNLEEVTNKYLEKLKNTNDEESISVYTKAVDQLTGKLMEIEKNQNDLEFDKQKNDESKKFKWKELIISGLFTAGGIIAGKAIDGAIDVATTNKILRFEETGTVASQPGRSWSSSLFKRHH